MNSSSRNKILVRTRTQSPLFVMSAPAPCVVCGTLTANEVRVAGVVSALCSATCRSKVTARTERRILVADWVTYSAREQGLAGRKSEMYMQGVRLEIFHNTEYTTRQEVFFLDDLRRDDLVALRAIVAMLREARADPPVGQPLPALPRPTVVFYPMETSSKWIGVVIARLDEHHDVD
jgi:hypothetical protein